MQLLQAAARAARGDISGLPEGLLRFHLEYASPPGLEAERVRIAALLGADRFSLRLSPPGADPELLLLEFPGVPREQSASLLFAEAADLADALGLVSCVPETEAGWIDGDELVRDMPESIEGAVARFCQSDAQPPADRRWAVRAVRADRAWARFGTKGEGILVAQPDTGVADHLEIDEGLEVSLGLDVIKGHGAPIDPLTQKGGNPGHGTATSSCVISRESGTMVGSAPGARLVPIRCINSVILTGGAATAAAIDHAVSVGAHVITMSLGGPVAWPALKRAIRRADEAGVVVLAAAGNCVRFVVYPGWDRHVIAVGGIDEHDKPWRGSNRGSAVDVAAPGENIYVARRTSPDDADLSLAAPGQGTSFAVATAAGVVALWLSHNGLGAVKAEAASRGTSVGALARQALMQTARRPAGWSDDLGAGVVDAEALLALPLASIAGTAKPELHPARAALGSPAALDRFGAEAGFLLFDRAQRADPTRDLALESPVVPLPSIQLRAALAAAGNAAEFAMPAIITGPVSPDLTPGKALRIIAGSRPDGSGGVVESTSGATEASARAYLGAEGRDELVARMEQVLGGLDAAADESEAASTLRQRVIADTPGVLKAFGEGASLSGLTPEARFATEALIRMTGRPAMRTVNGGLDPLHPEMGDWITRLAGAAAAQWLPRLLAAVGRIDLAVDGQHVHAGTGTVVADGLVMTNRHVLDAVADPLPGGGFLLRGPVTIVFDDEARDDSRRFALTEVVAAGAQRIGRQADLGKLDMAFFAIEARNGSGPAPKPVPPAGPMPFLPEVVVVGYPARPGAGAVIDPSTGMPSVPMVDRLAAIYQDKYGVKYLSPGEVQFGVGHLPGDSRGWAFSHDATTLGGNSGSPVIQLETRQLCGLHFAGSPLRQNMAHGIAAVRDLAASQGVIDAAVMARLFRPSGD
jgi:serine protease